MSESELKEYRQGDTVRLTVEMRDANGVKDGLAAAFLLRNGKPDEDRPSHCIDLTGWPEGNPEQTEIVLQARIEQQPPGVYACYAIVAANTYDALTRHELDPPLRFRIIESPDDVRKGPEVLSVGTFW